MNDPSPLAALVPWGWSEDVRSRWDAVLPPPGEVPPGRVLRAERDSCRVQTAEGEQLVDLLPRAGDRPVVGDWVGLGSGETFHGVHVAHVLPRVGAFTRKVAGKRARPQVLAANVDTTLIVTALDQDFSLRRIERYLTLAWDAGSEPWIILSKADLCDAVETRLSEVHEIARGAAVAAVTALTGAGLQALAPVLQPARTLVLLGSSGVGKSTLVNALSDDANAAVGAVRSDGKGRHTTTQREMFLLPSGALLIDSPGMRELALWADRQAVDRVFDDVEAVARDCRFSDCRHAAEDGCAVRAAIEVGDLDAARVDSFTRLRDETETLQQRRQQDKVTQGRWRKQAAKTRRRKTR